MSAFDTGWSRSSDGVPYRRAARVLPLRRDAVLLVRGRDFTNRQRSWWFTIGGGIEPGETPLQAAVRELREETGFVAHPADLVGPVAHRLTTLRFTHSVARQEEDYFLWRCPSAHGQVPLSLTDFEREVLSGTAWMTPDNIAEARREGAEVFPPNLAELVRGWLAGWDGRVVRLVDEG